MSQENNVNDKRRVILTDDDTVTATAPVDDSADVGIGTGQGSGEPSPPDPSLAAPEPPKRLLRPYNKGHMRDANSATKCQHLHIDFFIAMGQREIPSPIQLQGPGSQRAMIQRVVTAPPRMMFVCLSPDHVNAVGHDTSLQLGPDLGGQIRSLETSIPHCQMCPYHQIDRKLIPQ